MHTYGTEIQASRRARSYALHYLTSDIVDAVLECVMKKLTATAGAVICAGVLLAGCSSTPTRADLMRGHAADTQAQAATKNRLAADWDRGQAAIASGEKKIKDGEQLVSEGKRELRQGQRLVRDSEREFKQNFPDLSISAK